MDCFSNYKKESEFCPVCWGDGTLINLTSTNFDLKAYNLLAEQFTKDEFLLSYIKNILAKPEFQENPKMYVEKWQNERNDYAECFFREDQAFGFFYANF